VTLNDPQFVEAAKKLAGLALSQSEADDAQRLELISQRLLCRSLGEAERKILLDGLAGLRADYAQDKAAAEQLLGVGQLKLDPSLDPAETAAWTMLINEIMNLDEVLNK
jgi:hypothetical protein